MAFTSTRPRPKSKIDLVHDSVEKGNLRDLKALLDRRKLARSKDAQGVGLLHKAVVHGHRDIVDYLITDYPETLEVTDNDERVPLHYCAASKFPDDMYNLLCGVVQDTQVQDSKGKTAADYMSHPEDIHLVRRRSSSNKGSGDSKGKRRTLPKRNSPAHKITTPPKREGMNITGANIRIWIHDQDLARLEQIVWEGEGNRLLQETSNHAKVRQFLNLVPRMMAKIKEVHHAALKGDMETLDAKVEQPEILTAKDQNGLNPLHKSAALGNLEVSEWIVQKNQSTVFAQDRQGRTPLFYASVAKDGGEVYNMMLRAGADPSHVDKFGKTAEHYRYKPGELDLGMVHDVLNAPRSGGSTLDIPPGLSRAASNQNSRTPSRNNNYKSRNPSRKNSTGDDMRRANRSRRNSNKSDLQYKDLKDATEADIERFIRDGDLESLEYLVLSGRGSDLQGRSSWNEEVRRYLKKVPGYTEKITALHDASSKGDVKTAKRLTKENPRLSMARTHDGQVAMHVAAAAGNTPVVRHLLSLYPDAIRVEDASGRTPLHYAGLSRETGAHLTYDLLKREGASEGLQDQSGNTPLDYRHLPDKKDGPSRHLRSRGRSKLSTKDPSGGASRGASRAASRVASKGGSQGTSREPSRTNSPEEASGSKGPSRASSAAGGDEEVQKAIAAAEADEDYSLLSDMVVRGDGDSLVGHSSDDPEVNTFLENVPQHLESIDEVHDAAEAGETRKVMALLDTKKKALARDSNHCNILHKAVLHDHTDLSTQLCQKYPDLLQQEDLSGRTPLHYAAVVRGHEGHLYHTLLEAGGDATRPDQAGNNPDDYYRDPDLLTLGDLKKELADGLPTAQGSPEEDEGAGRPLTKGSETTVSYYGSEEDGMERLAPDILARLEEEYERLRVTKSRSLMKKFLTPEVFGRLKHRVTSSGASLLDVIKSGLVNLDSGIGLYAPDAESYTMFHELFDPVIDEYHGGFGPADYHPGINFGTANALGDLNEWGPYVVSTRVRCARSLEGYPFNPLLTNEQYLELEQDVERALDTLEGDLAGYYRPLAKLSPSEQQQLLEAHLLFKQGDRFLEAAGACRFWPEGRGIFLNADNTLVVWVSEEDHMRIISMQNGGDLAQVYDRFARAVTALGNRLPYSLSQRLGFLNFCPTNLGTAIRASVHIRVPHLGSDRRLLEDTADQFHLQVRGTSGEHSEAKDFVFDISNRRRLGLTEIEALQEMYDGVKEIIRLEMRMEESSSRKGSAHMTSWEAADTIAGH
ncbi:uncharacterized protein [Panulirus ornatus]|uniref:uncharacterized protein isoform X4 n=1 Tax=Panulirus ornatus TaxID=150431 RepID=UPI003A8AEC13